MKPNSITYEEINIVLGEEKVNEFFIPMYLVNVQTLSEKVLREVLKCCNQFVDDIASIINKKRD